MICECVLPYLFIHELQLAFDPIFFEPCYNISHFDKKNRKAPFAMSFFPFKPRCIS